MIKDIQHKLKNTTIKGYPIDKIMGAIADILVIPLFTIQLITVIKRGKSTDYSIFFILLQLFGTPEGGGALITGLVRKNWPLIIIGGYGVFYYLTILYYYLFPRVIANL
jgi:hypothetical protein